MQNYYERKRRRPYALRRGTGGVETYNPSQLKRGRSIAASSLWIYQIRLGMRLSLPLRRSTILGTLGIDVSRPVCQSTTRSLTALLNGSLQCCGISGRDVVPWLRSCSIRIPKPSNQAMELTASRCFIQLFKSSTRQYAATCALARGSSSCSR
jgi:hypothetical protein